MACEDCIYCKFIKGHQRGVMDCDPDETVCEKDCWQFSYNGDKEEFIKSGDGTEEDWEDCSYVRDIPYEESDAYWLEVESKIEEERISRYENK